MIHYINEKTAPYLNLLTVKTRLAESPVMKEMQSWALLCQKDFCIRIGASDVNHSGLAKIWMDLDTRWPLYVDRFASRVDIVDGTFLGSAHDSHEAFVEEDLQAGEYLAHKTFCGTIVMQPNGMSLSYVLSFDCLGDTRDDSSLLLLDNVGTIMVYISPNVQYVCREVKYKATRHLSYVMPPLDAMMGAAQMKYLVRDYLLYRHFAPVKTELVTRCGSDEEAGLADDSDALVNCFPFDIRRLTAHDGAFIFPDPEAEENDAGNE